MSPDEEVVQRVRAGETAAYAALVRAHQARILRLCASLLGDAALHPIDALRYE